MPGNKTHEHQLRQFEQGEDSQDGRSADPARTTPPRHPSDAAPNATDNPSGISRNGMRQETRGQNKHNSPGQSGHRPQTHTPDQEKH